MKIFFFIVICAAIISFVIWMIYSLVYGNWSPIDAEDEEENAIIMAGLGASMVNPIIQPQIIPMVAAMEVEEIIDTQANFINTIELPLDTIGAPEVDTIPTDDGFNTTPSTNFDNTSYVDTTPTDTTSYDNNNDTTSGC